MKGIHILAAAGFLVLMIIGFNIIGKSCSDDSGSSRRDYKRRAGHNRGHYGNDSSRGKLSERQKRMVKRRAIMMIGSMLRSMEQTDPEDYDYLSKDPQFAIDMAELKTKDPDRYEMNLLILKSAKQEKLPIFLFAPLDDTETVEHNNRLKDFIADGKKVRDGTATPEERKRYYETKISMISDKIADIQYYRDLIIEETGGKAREEKWNPAEMKQINRAIKKLEAELENARREYGNN